MQQPEPHLECDLVMRGGITSGIVYPRAVAELAKTFRFRSIGGTSAGAIAAAVTAAAAYGQAHGLTGSFDRIQQLPDELAEIPHGQSDSRLMSLFQPQDTTRPLFQLLMRMIRQGPSLPGLGTAIVRTFPVHAVIGALPGLAFLLLIWWTALALSQQPIEQGVLWLPIIASVPAALIALIGAMVAPACRTIGSAQADIPKNFFGLCTGMETSKAAGNTAPPLTIWLHQLIQKSAGLGPDAPPLTAGQLWIAPMGDGKRPPRGAKNIELILMTTNITRGVSTQFPSMEDWRNGMIFFNAGELENFLPKSVVDFMVENAQKRIQNRTGTLPPGVYRLPKDRNLPVIFGARLSLSFPFLLSAIPLYQIDWHASKDKDTFVLEKCWFSDGGLTSNFPVHFFDSPLPTRPTFGINLVAGSIKTLEEATAKAQKAELKEVGPTASAMQGAAIAGKIIDRDLAGAFDMVWMPKTNHPGLPGRFKKISTKGNFDFLAALFDTARNWTDSEQMMLPGYRDRIAHIHLDTNEGGYNLNMQPEAIKNIAERGSAAGLMLARRFAPRLNDLPNADPKDDSTVLLDWDNHRWVRFRSTMAALEDVSRNISPKWHHVRAGAPDEPTYDDLLARRLSDAPSYKWANGRQRTHAHKVTRDYISIIKRWARPTQTFDRTKLGKPNGQSPRPKSKLRMMPP